MSRAWHVVRDLVLTEVAIWGMLARWIARRPDVPHGAAPVGYAQLVAPVLWLWIIAAGGEAIALELILRSIDAGWAHVVRVPLLVVGVWGTLWMLGLMAAFRMRPHLVMEDRLRIRSGPRTWVDVPKVAIRSVTLVEHEFDGIMRTVHEDEGLLLVGVSRRTNVELALTGPTVLASHAGDRTASTVGLWVDEPRSFAALLRGSSRGRTDNAIA